MPLMIYDTATLTSFSDSISYIAYLFSEWRILALIHAFSIPYSFSRLDICQPFKGKLCPVAMLPQNICFPISECGRVFLLLVHIFIKLSFTPFLRVHGHCHFLVRRAIKSS